MAIRLELGGLLAQFLLGMYVNLYVSHPHSQPLLIAHIALGIALLGLAVVTLGCAVAEHHREHALVALIGALALVGAVAGGSRFLKAGQHSGDSFLMAVGFAVSISAFGIGVLVAERDQHGG